MPESKPDKAAKQASSPDELVKDLDVRVSEEERSKVKGGAVDSFSSAKKK